MPFLRKNLILLSFFGFVVPFNVFAGIEDDYKREQQTGKCSYENAQFIARGLIEKYCVNGEYLYAYYFVGGRGSFKGVLNRFIESGSSLKKVKIDGHQLVEYSCKGDLLYRDGYSYGYNCISPIRKKVLGERTAAFNPSSNNYFSVLMKRGIANYKSGKKNKAIQEFSKAIATDPDNADAYAWRGETRMSVSRGNNGCDDINKARSINPNHAGPRYYHRICNHKNY